MILQIKSRNLAEAEAPLQTQAMDRDMIDFYADVIWGFTNYWLIGWWFGAWLDYGFPYILNFIIPTDL